MRFIKAYTDGSPVLIPVSIITEVYLDYNKNNCRLCVITDGKPKAGNFDGGADYSISVHTNDKEAEQAMDALLLKLNAEEPQSRRMTFIEPPQV